MRVTKFQYPLEATLIKKLNMMIKRCMQKSPKRDAVLLNEGAEGEGKTSMSVAQGYYIAEQTGRPFSHENIFFDVDKMITFLQNTEGQIAIWDEPALQALSGDAMTKVVRNLKRMLMMCRNRRHFIIINMTYFTEFGNYIVWQRPLGMIHVYSRNELQSGRFIYIKKKYLERLWLDWRSKKQRNYKKWSAKGCRGSFPDVLNPEYEYNVLSEFNFQAYEKNKNDAINSIGKEEKKLNKREIIRDYILECILRNENKLKLLTNKDLSKLLGISEMSFYRYKASPPSSHTTEQRVSYYLGDEGTKDESVPPKEEEKPIIYTKLPQGVVNE